MSLDLPGLSAVRDALVVHLVDYVLALLDSLTRSGKRAIDADKRPKLTIIKKNGII